MPSPKRLDADAALAELSRLARRDLVDTASPPEDARGWAEVRERLARNRNRSPRSTMTWIFAAAAIAVVLVGGIGMLVGRPKPIEYTVEAGTIDEGGYVRATGAAGPTIHFSEGSQVGFLPSSRGRINSTTRDGAQLTVEDGGAEVSIVHRPRAAWLVDVGPFAIAVIGTSFKVQWSSAEEVLDVRMHSGVVGVRGPLAPGGITVKAGQRLLVRVRSGEVRLDPDRDEALASPRDDAPEGLGAEPANDDGIVTNAARPPADHRAMGSRLAEARSWSKLLASGEFRSILSQAEQIGIESALSTTSRQDLAALADAARYSRRIDIAERALAAERQRFRGSVQAKEAAFFLGRLAEDAARLREAVAWYDTYLTEAPNGSYASEGLGRKMVAIQKMGGTETARQVARQYLDRFPRGAYAVAANQLLDSR
jgi:TolA-binding protein/ferric-dicitrate binding protein FerR (iron transport regulator)